MQCEECTQTAVTHVTERSAGQLRTRHYCKDHARAQMVTRIEAAQLPAIWPTEDTEITVELRLARLLQGASSTMTMFLDDGHRVTLPPNLKDGDRVVLNPPSQSCPGRPMGRIIITVKLRDD